MFSPIGFVWFMMNDSFSTVTSQAEKVQLFFPSFREATLLRVIITGDMFDFGPMRIL